MNKNKFRLLIVKTGIKYLVVSLLMLNISISYAVQDYTVKQSRYSVGETIDRLESIIKQKGIIVYSRIYHSMGAKKAGIAMRPTQLIIFGNPKAGSPLINENPLAALDLPLKVMAWQDEKNQTWLAYMNSNELRTRHNIQNAALLAEMDALLKTITNQALGYK